MYKINKKYKNTLMALNLMGVHHYRRNLVTSTEILFLFGIIICFGLAFLISTTPEIGFLAQCQNVPDGDVCSISIQ